jgi:hypothetical protein
VDNNLYIILLKGYSGATSMFSLRAKNSHVSGRKSRVLIDTDSKSDSFSNKKYKLIWILNPTLSQIKSSRANARGDLLAICIVANFIYTQITTGLKIHRKMATLLLYTSCYLCIN